MEQRDEERRLLAQVAKTKPRPVVGFKAGKEKSKQCSGKLHHRLRA